LAKHLPFETHQTSLACGPTEITFFATKGAIVDLTVAIVVFAIADLGDRFNACAFYPCPAFTSLCSFFASADVAAAGTGSSALALTAFVDLSVAIVVFAIADLRLWLGSRTSPPFSCAARFLASPASCAACARKGLVDFSVTIVVFVVADLGAWGATNALHVFATTAFCCAIGLELGGASVAVA
jgi:hypothetical protein